MMQEFATRCRVHDRTDEKDTDSDKTMSKVNTNVLVSEGADTNRLGFYSTTKSISYVDWAPEMNLITKPNIYKKPTQPRKQKTGFTSIKHSLH
jgi:hypothetical protein